MNSVGMAWIAVLMLISVSCKPHSDSEVKDIVAGDPYHYGTSLQVTYVQRDILDWILSKSGKLESHELNEGRPAANPLGKLRPFNDFYDWHSSISAYAIGLKLAEDLGDWKSHEKLLAHLKGKYFEGEYDIDRHYEKLKVFKYQYPYGWLWLIHLVKDLAKVETIPERIKFYQEFETFLAEGILKWLENPSLPAHATPIQKKYKSFYTRGDHYSWTFTMYLMGLYFDEGSIPQRFKKIYSDWYKKHLLMKYDLAEWDFVHVEAMAKVMACDEDNLIGSNSVKRPDLDDSKISYEAVHGYGQYTTYLIYDAFVQSRNYARGIGDLLKSLEAITKFTQTHKDQFALVTHWVPNFIGLATLTMKHPQRYRFWCTLANSEKRK